MFLSLQNSGCPREIEGPHSLCEVLGTRVFDDPQEISRLEDGGQEVLEGSPWELCLRLNCRWPGISDKEYHSF